MYELSIRHDYRKTYVLKRQSLCVSDRWEPQMELVYRLIFRLDFDPKFELANLPGSIIKILSDHSKGYWEMIGPTNSTYQINAARNLSAARNRSGENFAVDTNAISGGFDIDEGITFEGLLSSRYVEVCNKTLNELLSSFDIRHFNRVGVRLFMSGGATEDFIQHREKVAARFKALVVPRDNESMEVADIAMILVGRFDHDVEYRLQFGPGNENDIDQFLGRERIKISETKVPHEFAADIDIYQQNLNFRGTNLLKWLKAKEIYIKKLLSVAQYSVKVGQENVGK